MLDRLTRINRKIFLLAAGCVLGAFGAGTDAAIITGYTVVGNGNGTATVSIINNSIVITGKNFTSLGPIDITFNTANSGGVPNTYTVAEGITNNVSPAVTWTDYHEQLGSGTGNNFVDLNTLVTFAPPTVNSNFGLMTLAPQAIDMSQGTVTPGNTLSVGFDLTVPDEPAGGGASFTLRQYPTVPEPATVSLLAVGSLGLFARRRRA
jgi:hypothetical protein